MFNQVYGPAIVTTLGQSGYFVRALPDGNQNLPNGAVPRLRLRIERNTGNHGAIDDDAAFGPHHRMERSRNADANFGNLQSHRLGILRKVPTTRLAPATRRPRLSSRAPWATTLLSRRRRVRFTHRCSEERSMQEPATISCCWATAPTPTIPRLGRDSRIGRAYVQVWPMAITSSMAWAPG